MKLLITNKLYIISIEIKTASKPYKIIIIIIMNYSKYYFQCCGLLTAQRVYKYLFKFT